MEKILERVATSLNNIGDRLTLEYQQGRRSQSIDLDDLIEALHQVASDMKQKPKQKKAIKCGK